MKSGARVLKSRIIVFAISLLLSACASMGSGGWITLLDGEKGMENWNITSGGNWHAEDGARVAYREAGSGPPLVLLHSLGLSHRELEPVVGHLDHRYKVLLPDLPLSRLREAGRFVKNLWLPDGSEPVVRAPVEVTMALFRNIVGKPACAHKVA